MRQVLNRYYIVVTFFSFLLVFRIPPRRLNVSVAGPVYSNGVLNRRKTSSRQSDIYFADRSTRGLTRCYRTRRLVLRVEDGITSPTADNGEDARCGRTDI